MYKRHHFLLMSALGVALSAGGAAVAAAFDSAEKLVVTGALKATHVITEQVCDFDTLEQLENYLANIADRHNWFRHDQPAGVLIGAAAQVDTTSAQYHALATATALADATGGTLIAGGSDAPASLEVRYDLGQLRQGFETNQATAQLNPDGSPMRNPHYEGQFDGETIEEAEARRAAANVAQLPAATEEPAAGAAPEAPASIELPTTPTDTAA